MSSGIVALLTDFGSRDPFVGMMKGVMMGVNPALQLIDLSHEITPQGIREAAIILSLSYRYFPSETIFVVVVDPGVGGRRRALVAEIADYTFVAPDNGVLGPVLRDAKIRRVVHATNREYFRKPISRTFHGRDVFAPVAAWLSRGIAASAMGSTIDDYVRLQLPQPCVLAGGALAGEIIYQDRFGNLITNLSETWVMQQWGVPPWEGVVAHIEKSIVQGLDSYYAQRSANELGIIVNSWGLLEIFANGGHAAQITGAGAGTPITIRRVPAAHHVSGADEQGNDATGGTHPL